jgi:hypothetical protein
MKDLLLKNRMFKAGVKAAAFVVIIALALGAFTACANPQPRTADEAEVATSTDAAITPAAVSATPAASDATTPPSVASPEIASPAAAVPESVSPAATIADPAEAAPEESDAETKAKPDAKNAEAKDDGGSSNSDKKKAKEKAKKDKNKDSASKKEKDAESKTDNDSGKSKDSDQPKADDEAKPKAATKITVSIAVDCLTLFDNDPGLAGQVSNNGVILDKKDVTVADGDSVYDVIKASGVTFVGKTYISSIGGLSEGDGGAKSGWMYSVNGAFPAIGITLYKVKDGDSVQFRYTLNSGADVK